MCLSVYNVHVYVCSATFAKYCPCLFENNTLHGKENLQNKIQKSVLVDEELQNYVERQSLVVGYRAVSLVKREICKFFFFYLHNLE